ncbi:MAG: Gamma-DL-glutamyl hydrolase precursor [Firmicutes bacterium ADurb.Bin193]|nr:MAG: Gamma-DL-glutamyl hydrolase precursor [Firmicutes bacterium ADurb.Bin193]
MGLSKKLLRLFFVTAGVLLFWTAAASADTALVKANGGLNLRTGPGTNHSIICTIPNGTIITVDGVQDGWIKATYNGKNGFVSAQYVTIRKEATDRSGVEVNRQGNPTGVEVVEYAKKYLGYKYRYGGSSPSTGFDCSGFTSYVYKQFGYTLNRTAAGQTQNGVAVSFDDIMPGDLLIFSNAKQTYGHVGIYAGDGWFIHSVQTGTPVSMTGLWTTNYGRRLKVVRRIIN